MADIFNIDDFTQGTIGGTGVFDVLMTAVKAHLRVEFDAGRIRATDYSNAYVQLMSAVLSESGQYVISKARLAAEIKLLEAQARGEDASTGIKEYQLVNILPIEKDNLLKQGLSLDAQTAQTTQQIVNLVTQELQLVEQTKGIVVETAIKQYQLDCILPKEANNLLLVGIRTAGETSQAVQQTNNLMEQHKGIVTDNAIKKFQYKEILPLEKTKTLEQIVGMQKDNEMKSFQIDFVLPKELELKAAQVNVALKDLELKAKQLELSAYELTHKLPADVGLITAQDELYTQKTVTEKAQTDKSVVGVGSVIDTNNKLLVEQSKVYLRNAQQTAAKLLIDTWNVRHSSDPDGNLENEANKLTDSDIGAAITRMNGNLT